MTEFILDDSTMEFSNNSIRSDTSDNIPLWQQTLEKIVSNSDFPDQSENLFSSSSNTTISEIELGNLEKDFYLLISTDLDKIFDYEDLAFRESIYSILHDYGSNFLLLFLSKLEGSIIEISLASRIIKLLGSIRDQNSRKNRLWLLEHLLLNPSKYIRNSAVIGLASIGDPSSISYLEKALVNEKSKLLSSTIKEVINQLGEKDDVKMVKI